MTFSIALPRSTEKLSSAVGLESEKGPKNGVAQGGDGFAGLLNDLAALMESLPGASSEADAVADGRQAIELPTGKTLPLSPLDLPVAAITDDGSEEIGDGTEVIALAAPAAAVAIIGETPVSQITVRVGNADGRAMPETSTTDTIPATTTKAETNPAGTAFASAPAKIDASADKQAAGLQVRIAAADRPQDAKAAGMVAASPAPPVEGKAATGTANAGQALVESTRVADAAGRQPGEEKSGGEKHASGAHGGPAAEATRAMPQALSTSFEDAIDATRPVTVAVRATATDQFANVERVVEHLMAARQMDLSKPTAIAVAHREFGALTVTFDQSAGGMNVEIAAENHEAQRALAAAMANDRGAGRQPDTGWQSSPAQNHSGSATADRATSNGNSGAAPGHGGNAENRSQHPEQRSRQGGSASSRNQSPTRTPGDDALYA